jgi:hypothetical protein
MIDVEGANGAVLVGSRRYPRYAVSFNRYLFLPMLYWTGVVEDPWTTEVSEAMTWADYGAVMDAMRAMETAEPDDSPGARKWDSEWLEA